MRPRLTYANVVSTIALVFAIGTGGTWAATQISGGVIKKNTITGNKIRKGTITHREINEKKLKAVPRAVTADKLAGQAPESFLPAGGTAANANQLGGIGPTGFVQGGGNYTSGRTAGASGADPNTLRTLTTPVGEFRLSCGGANAEARYVNTTAGAADVFHMHYRAAGDDDTAYAEVAENAAVWYAATEAIGPVWIDMRAGKGNSLAILRVGERRTAGGQCIFNWELIQSG